MHSLQGILLIIVQMLVIKIMLLIFMQVAEIFCLYFKIFCKISKNISNNAVDIYASSGHGP